MIDPTPITITRAQLRVALLSWEQDARDGKTRTHEETDELPIEQVADESTAWLWSALGGAE